MFDLCFFTTYVSTGMCISLLIRVCTQHKLQFHHSPLHNHTDEKKESNNESSPVVSFFLGCCFSLAFTTEVVFGARAVEESTAILFFVLPPSPPLAALVGTKLLGTKAGNTFDVGGARGGAEGTLVDSKAMPTVDGTVVRLGGGGGGGGTPSSPSTSLGDGAAVRLGGGGGGIPSPSSSLAIAAVAAVAAAAVVPAAAGPVAPVPSNTEGLSSFSPLVAKHSKVNSNVAFGGMPQAGNPFFP